MVGYKAYKYGIPKNEETAAGTFQRMDLDKAHGHYFLRGHRGKQHELSVQ